MSFFPISEPRNSGDITRGRLTERLLAQGLLTPQMLRDLRKEWDQQAGGSGGGSSDETTLTTSPRKPRRKRKNSK